jgi:hypothetical protein
MLGIDVVLPVALPVLVFWAALAAKTAMQVLD